MPLLCLCACAGAPPAPDGARVRVTSRQFYDRSIPVVVENEAGRDVRLLRRRQNPKDPPVAYVPDETMAELLRQLTKLGFEEYAAAPEPESALAGARAEIRIEGEAGAARAFVRRAGQGARASEVYTDCLGAVLAVYNFHQASRTQAGEGDFGVRRVGK